MSLLAFLAAVSPLAPASPPPAVAQEMVVIGQKLKLWKGGVSKVGGKMICRTRKSSGDRQIDAVRCGALLACMQPLEARIDALMASDVAANEKKRRFAQFTSGLEVCAAGHEATAVLRLAENRAGT